MVIEGCHFESGPAVNNKTAEETMFQINENCNSAYK